MKITKAKKNARRKNRVSSMVVVNALTKNCGVAEKVCLVSSEKNPIKNY
jgi:hypothetical protein